MKWISVNDELPQYKVHVGGRRFVMVLVAINGMVGEGMYQEGQFSFLDVDTDRVTHWMYLPDPPVE